MSGEKAVNVLVINLRYIGDTLWTFPFLRNLRANLPDARISLLVNKGGEELLRLLPDVDEVLVFDRKDAKGLTGVFRFAGFLRMVRRKGFDTVFILSNSDRPTIIGYLSGAKKRIGIASGGRWRERLLTEMSVWNPDINPHMIQCYLQVLTDRGFAVHDSALSLTIPREKIERTLNRFGLSETGEKTIIVHPGARTAMRQWGSDNFAAVINAVSDKCRIFLTGGPSEGAVVQDIARKLHRPPAVVSTELSLMEFASLCSISNLFIGNDSAPIHIAAATGIHVIGMYGPTLSGYCGPWTDKRTLFDISTLPCRLCRQDVCVQEESQACLREITPEMVIAKVKKILAG